MELDGELGIAVRSHLVPLRDVARGAHDDLVSSVGALEAGRFVLLLAVCGPSALPMAGGAKPGDGTEPTSPAPRAVAVEPPARPTAEPVATAGAQLAEDALGPLALGMAVMVVEKALRPAEKKIAPETEEGATGD